MSSCLNIASDGTLHDSLALKKRDPRQSVFQAFYTWVVRVRAANQYDTPEVVDQARRSI